MTTGDASNQTEVIDISNPYNSCTVDLPYPGEPGTYGTSGGLVNGKPFVCGGTKSGVTAFDTCYFLGEDTSVQSNLTLPRVNSPAISVDNSTRLWLLGGGIAIQSTELIGPGDVAIPGPNMPAMLKHHCAVELADGYVMIIGGYDIELDERSDKSWIKDPYFDNFLPGPNLTAGKNSMACGVLYDDDAGEEIVVVAGGYDGEYIDTIETWTVGSDENFEVTGSTGIGICCGAGNYNQMLFYRGMSPYVPTITGVVLEDQKSMFIIGGFSMGAAREDR